MTASAGNADDVVLVLTTCPDDERVEALARTLVESRLAACVNCLSPMQSQYWWKGQVEQSAERQLVIKTTRGHLAGLERFFAEHHPYDVPEYLVIPAEGSAAYLGWVRDETGARGARQ